MRKQVFAIAAMVALVIASCSKKEENKLMDSNTMLEEPEVVVTDTTKAKPQVAAAPVAETPAAEKDTATTKK